MATRHFHPSQFDFRWWNYQQARGDSPPW